MKTATIPISWVVEHGHRFDCGPFTRGGIEAKKAVESLPVPKSPLVDLTAGGMDGMYHVGMDKLQWVDMPDHGVPLLRSSDILCADLTMQPLISRTQVSRNPLFTCAEGGTLITRSGSIGRMAYCRKEMAAMGISQDVLKVVPNARRILSGYLYAFLSSRYGVPLVASGTFGSIIVHIEAENIAGLPVPRFGEEFESAVHGLVERAAGLRTDSAHLLAEAVKELEEAASLSPLNGGATAIPSDLSIVPASRTQARMDALFHSRFHRQAVEAISKAPMKRIGDYASQIIEPARFKRVAVEDTTNGLPFFGTSALFWADPSPNYFIPRKMPRVEQYVVTRKCVLIPRSGQLTGIIGSAVLPFGDVVGGAVSEDAIRVCFHSEDAAGFCFVALTSEYGRRQLKARAFGSSIPHLDVHQIADVVIPYPNEAVVARLGSLGSRVATLRDQACRIERQARGMIEAKIQQGGG